MWFQSVDELMALVHQRSSGSALQAGAYVSNALNFALWMVLWANRDVSIWNSERQVVPLHGSPWPSGARPTLTAPKWSGSESLAPFQ